MAIPVAAGDEKPAKSNRGSLRRGPVRVSGGLLDQREIRSINGSFVVAFGQFYVAAGSLGRAIPWPPMGNLSCPPTKDERPGIHPYMSRIRSRLIADGLLEESGDRFRLSADYRFGSPSTASGVLLGRTSNGLTEWKTPEGTSIKELRLAVAEID